VTYFTPSSRSPTAARAASWSSPSMKRTSLESLRASSMGAALPAKSTTMPSPPFASMVRATRADQLLVSVVLSQASWFRSTSSSAVLAGVTRPSPRWMTVRPISGTAASEARRSGTNGEPAAYRRWSGLMPSRPASETSLMAMKFRPLPRYRSRKGTISFVTR
jgi:hypothetical protein